MKKQISSLLSISSAVLVIAGIILGMFLPFLNSGIYGNATLINLLNLDGNIKGNVLAGVIIYLGFLLAVLCIVSSTVDFFFSSKFKESFLRHLIIGVLMVFGLGFISLISPILVDGGLAGGISSEATIQIGAIISGVLFSLAGLVEIINGLLGLFKIKEKMEISNLMSLLSIFAIVATFLLMLAPCYISSNPIKTASFFDAICYISGNKGASFSPWILVLLSLSLVGEYTIFSLKACGLKSNYFRYLNIFFALLLLTSSFMLWFGYFEFIDFYSNAQIKNSGSYGYGCILTGLSSLLAIVPLGYIIFTDKPVYED